MLVRIEVAAEKTYNSAKERRFKQALFEQITRLAVEHEINLTRIALVKPATKSTKAR